MGICRPTLLTEMRHLVDWVGEAGRISGVMCGVDGEADNSNLMDAFFFFFRRGEHRQDRRERPY